MTMPRAKVGEFDYQGARGNANPKAGWTRIIGLELRYDDGMGQRPAEELAIFACDIEIPSPHAMYNGMPRGKLTLTAHLSIGDRNGEIQL